MIKKLTALAASQDQSMSSKAGLLRPFPVPHHPWSHILLDVVTGLPPSDGNTAILTIVDRFSKMVHIVPLPKLPSAKETAQAILVHVFQLHGLPVDMVSDRGPQFTSVLWSEFCNQRGATVIVFWVSPTVQWTF